MDKIKKVMNFFIELFNKAGKDGMMHIILCALFSCLLSLILPWWVVAPLLLLVGVAKELYDKKNGGTCEWKDIICDVVGIIIGVL